MGSRACMAADAAQCRLLPFSFVLIVTAAVLWGAAGAQVKGTLARLDPEFHAIYANYTPRYLDILGLNQSQSFLLTYDSETSYSMRAYTVGTNGTTAQVGSTVPLLWKSNLTDSHDSGVVSATLDSTHSLHCAVYIPRNISVMFAECALVYMDGTAPVLLADTVSVQMSSPNLTSISLSPSSTVLLLMTSDSAVLYWSVAALRFHIVVNVSVSSSNIVFSTLYEDVFSTNYESFSYIKAGSSAVLIAAASRQNQSVALFLADPNTSMLYPVPVQNIQETSDAYSPILFQLLPESGTGELTLGLIWHKTVSSLFTAIIFQQLLYNGSVSMVGTDSTMPTFGQFIGEAPTNAGFLTVNRVLSLYDTHPGVFFLHYSYSVLPFSSLVAGFRSELNGSTPVHVVEFQSLSAPESLGLHSPSFLAKLPGSRNMAYAEVNSALNAVILTAFTWLPVLNIRDSSVVQSYASGVYDFGNVNASGSTSATLYLSCEGTALYSSLATCDCSIAVLGPYFASLNLYSASPSSNLQPLVLSIDPLSAQPPYINGTLTVTCTGLPDRAIYLNAIDSSSRLIVLSENGTAVSSGSILELGTVDIGQSLSYEVELYNIGLSQFVFSAKITTPNTTSIRFQTGGPFGGIIAPGDEHAVVIVFTDRNGAAEQSAYLSVESTFKTVNITLLARVTDPAADSTTTGNGSNSDASVLAGAIGGSVGGFLLLLILPAICCLMLLASCCVFCVLLVVFVVVLAVIALATAAVVAIGGAGAVGGVVALRRGRKLQRDAHRTLAEALDMGGDLHIHGNYRELAFDDLVFLEEIGEGAFGKVYRGLWMGAEVAIKMLRVEAVSEDSIAEARHEAEVMTKVGNHPNVVTFVGAVTVGQHFCLVTEFCQHGSFQDMLTKRRDKYALERDDIVQMALDAARGLAYLHSQGVVHRDVATRNYLVGDKMQLMISDFGTSRILDLAARDGGDDGSETAEAARTKSTVGPVRWMAPESLRDREYSAASDAWMFGCMLYEMQTRRVPYHGLTVFEVAVGVTNGSLALTVPADDAVPILVEQMQALLVRDVATRRTLPAVVASLEQYLGVTQSRRTTASSARATNKRGVAKNGGNDDGNGDGDDENDDDADSMSTPLTSEYVGTAAVPDDQCDDDFAVSSEYVDALSVPM